MMKFLHQKMYLIIILSGVELQILIEAWIRNFALAITRESLGNIRNVFASLTTPNGEINLNGDQLINDGRR